MNKKRKQITNEIKLQILENKKQLKPSELAIEYSLPASTISTIFANKDKILKHFEQNIINNDNKRIRTSNFPEIEESLMIWFNQVIAKPDITVDGPLIRA